MGYFWEKVTLFVIIFIHFTFVLKLFYGRLKTIYRFGLLWLHYCSTILFMMLPYTVSIRKSFHSSWWEWKLFGALCEFRKCFSYSFMGVLSPASVVSLYVFADQKSAKDSRGSIRRSLDLCLFNCLLSRLLLQNSSFLGFSELRTNC